MIFLSGFVSAFVSFYVSGAYPASSLFNRYVLAYCVRLHSAYCVRSGVSFYFCIYIQYFTYLVNIEDALIGSVLSLKIFQNRLT